MKALRLYVRLVDRLSTVVGLLVSILVPAMMLVIAYEVFVRYFLRHPTVWVFDTAIFMFGYIGLLAGAYVMRRNQHINVDVIHSRLSPRGKAVIDALTMPLVIFFLVLVVIYGWQFASDGIGRGVRRPTEWGPPLGHYMLMIPIGAGLLILQAVANWIRNLYRAVTGMDFDAWR